MEPTISVVIPVRNEARCIARTLEQLRGQTYPVDRVELLVCDGRSDDDTRRIVREIAADDPRVRLLDNPGLRSSSGRNVGFREARGDYVLVVDGHVEIPGPGLLRAVADCFERSGADALARPQPLIASPGDRWAEAIVVARGTALGHAPGSTIYGEREGFVPAASSGAAYRRETIERVGPVDESFDACEDLEFNTRIDKAGLRCFISPSLAVRYHARDSPAALFRQLHRYGYGRFKYLMKHPDRVSPGQLAPPALVLLVAGWLPLAALAPRLAALAAIPLVVWLAAIAGTAGLAALRHGAGTGARLLVVLPVIHLAVGTGFLAALVRGGRVEGAARDRRVSRG